MEAMAAPCQQFTPIQIGSQFYSLLQFGVEGSGW